MASGDLTASAPVYVDTNDGVLIKSTIDALNLSAVTDILHIITLPKQNKVMIFKVERAA